MIEIFYEESANIVNYNSAAKKYSLFKAISVFFFVLLAVWIYIFLFHLKILQGNVFLNIVVSLIPASFFFAVAIVFGKIKNKFCIDYDYTFISGEVRIDKVTKQIKRKQILTFSTKEIEKLGKFGSASFNSYLENKTVSKQVFTSNISPAEGKAFYYMVINRVQKKLLIFECSEVFIMNILKFSSPTILEREFR